MTQTPTCGCDRQKYEFAAMWTNAGLPAHVHDDGTTASGGPDGQQGGSNAKHAAADLVARNNWVKRNWQ